MKHIKLYEEFSSTLTENVKETTEAEGRNWKVGTLDHPKFGKLTTFKFMTNDNVWIQLSTRQPLEDQDNFMIADGGSAYNTSWSLNDKNVKKMAKDLQELSLRLQNDSFMNLGKSGEGKYKGKEVKLKDYVDAVEAWVELRDSLLSESVVSEAVNASGYIKAGKLGYNDQFLGRQSLSRTLSLDLGLKASNEFVGPWIGFDHVSMYVSGKNGGTILDDALTGKYTYDELKAAAAKHLGIKESRVNEEKLGLEFDIDGDTIKILVPEIQDFIDAEEKGYYVNLLDVTAAILADEGYDEDEIADAGMMSSDAVYKKIAKAVGIKESVNEAVDASGYIKAGKLGYNDQFRGRQSLSKTLSLDLGLSPKNEFTGPWIGFDHVSMYASGDKGGTILDDALAGKYTYDELKAAAAEHMGIKESVVNEAKALSTKEAIKKFEKDVEGPRDASDLAMWCYDNYAAITGLPEEDRDEEMDYPGEIEDLMNHYDFDEDEFNDYFGESVSTKGMKFIPTFESFINERKDWNDPNPDNIADEIFAYFSKDDWNDSFWAGDLEAYMRDEWGPNAGIGSDRGFDDAYEIVADRLSDEGYEV